MLTLDGIVDQLAGHNAYLGVFALLLAGGLGVPIPKTYFGRYEMTSQFEGAERIADKWGLTRDDTDAFGFASQQRAARAWPSGGWRCRCASWACCRAT